MRLLTGPGNYLDGVAPPDRADAHILRSPHARARARIEAIDTLAANAAPQGAALV